MSGTGRVGACRAIYTPARFFGGGMETHVLGRPVTATNFDP